MAQRIAVILAGGEGKRLWPLSSALRPKPLLEVDGKTLYASTLERAAAWAGHILTLTTAGLIEPLREEAKKAGIASDFLLEPEPRNTAAAIACAAAFSGEILEGGPMAVFPSDHRVLDHKAFHRDMLLATESAENGLLATFGIRPKRVEPGYGYMVTGETEGQGLRVAKFVEKPHVSEAADLIATGKAWWNAGIFVAHTNVWEAEFQRHAPELWRVARDAVGMAAFGNDSVYLDVESYQFMPSVPVDRAVMEKSARLVLHPAGFDWADMGEFGAIWDILPKDQAGNALKGKAACERARNCLVMAEDGLEVSLDGLDDVAVIAREGVIRVTRLR
ncbi:MAG: mannose-1-phosphate guanylyltransferase [Alphaproteobacteria bacterium]|nr:mannose-1-phosphate guanylyltransferase [Alphaproteobacteria bacterium]